ncbi:MAG: hypothetical protein JRI80_01890 [Deltaproteobacteria bacterium]|nr:hypothetical protein [Deltaproteobacteria bacterium]
MKISDANGSMMPGINGPRAGKSKAKGAFQEVMSQVMEQRDGKTAEPASVNTAGASPNIAPTQLIRNVEGQNSIPSGAQVMKEVESALDLAGFYTKKLENPAIKAASLEPLVTHLEEKMEGLRFLKDQGNIDEELKKIVFELDLAVGTEVARFRRGDYS